MNLVFDWCLIIQ